jgi:hypothetical protein
MWLRGASVTSTKMGPMAMDRELAEHIEVIERNQRTIQKEIVDTRNDLHQTYQDLNTAFGRLFKRLDEIERQIKSR